MKTFKVSISVIKVYTIEVQADTPEEAVQTAQDSSSVEIETSGELTLCETDYAEVIDE